jgi:hypothetical protein
MRHVINGARLDMAAGLFPMSADAASSEQWTRPSRTALWSSVRFSHPAMNEFLSSDRAQMRLRTRTLHCGSDRVRRGHDRSIEQ